jgi:signal transduction histidine kinase
MNTNDSARNYRILVIDDNRAIHDDFRKILCPPSAEATALGEAEAKLFGEPTRVRRSVVFEIDSAYQGEEGLGRLQQALQDGRPYAMAIVDVRMPPGWDGIETTQKLWAADPDLQVVICSAYSDYSWDEIIGKLGNSDHLLFLKKPFDTVEILQLANALTEKWRLIREVRSQMDHLEGTVMERTRELRETNEKLLAEIAGHRESKERLQQVLEDLRSTQQQIIQQERLRALGQMASGIAHDFNNALAPILGFSELLLDQPKPHDKPDTLRQYLQIINTASRDAASTVSRLREFYRTRDKQEIMKTIDLQQLVNQAVSLTQPRWKDQTEMHGIRIHVETDLRDVPPLLGNEADLREVLTNLIFNAVDAMPQGGRIAIIGHREDGHVVISISDTGTGMTEEVRRRCLEPFFTTKGERGTGLGLSMVYGIVHRHEGTLDIQTEEGRGTTFLIRLPLQTKTAEASTNRTVEVLPPRHLRVLVVDDEPRVLEVEAKYLEAAGHCVAQAASGPEGLEMCRAEKFDLVVLDRAMPGMSGDQLASAVKQLSADTPVIMLTGFGDLMDATCEKPPHVDVLLKKPITLAGFHEAVRKTTAVPSKRGTA